MQSDNLSICNGPRPVYDDLLLIYGDQKEIYGGPELIYGGPELIYGDRVFI